MPNTILIFFLIHSYCLLITLICFLSSSPYHLNHLKLLEIAILCYHFVPKVSWQPHMVLKKTGINRDNRDYFDETIKNLISGRSFASSSASCIQSSHTHTYIQTYMLMCLTTIFLCQMQSSPFIKCIPTPWAETSCGQV